jgi:hypothetical protein
MLERDRTRMHQSAPKNEANDDDDDDEKGAIEHSGQISEEQNALKENVIKFY